MPDTKSTCPYCGVGCGVIIETDAGAITGVRGDPDHPANFGRLCSKGSTLHLTATHAVTMQTRLLRPQLRAARGESPQPIAWDAALDLAADRFAATIAAHGPDAVAFYISGQLLTEDYYVFNKLAKGLVGTNNVDTNSRLCMSSAVAGYKATLGADAPPCCYDDLAHAATLFIAGSNTAFAHPILFRRIEDARRANPELKIVVVDPRRTETAQAADLHLAILPGTDVALYHGLLHVMLWEGWLDSAYIAAHTAASTRSRHACATSRRRTSRGCAASPRPISCRRRAGSRTSMRERRRRPTLSLYCQGLNQSTSGTAKNAALINLHLATGQIGKAGAGPFSLTGQPNAMGGREVGGMANLLSAHRDLGNAAHRAEVAALWGIADVPAKPGKTAVEMFQAAADGEIKALWIACTNPAQSMPDQAMVRRALERCEFVVVQEAFATTATCAFADLLLPRRPGARRTAPSPTASGASAASGPRSLRRAKRARTGRSRPTSRAGSSAVCCGADAAASLFPYANASRCGTSTARRRAAATSTSPASATRARVGARALALARGRERRPRAPLRRRHLPDRRRPRALLRHRLCAAGGDPRRALPVRAQHRPAARPVARHEPHRLDRPPLRPCARAGRRHERRGHGAARTRRRRSGHGRIAARRAS